MKIMIIWALLVLSGCPTKSNPDACCTTQQQCDSVGLNGITNCAGSQVCNASGACVMTECSTSPDCTSPDKPVCINHLCVAKCTVDDDCNGLAGTPHCGTDGVCVACIDDTQCTADVPVCDSQAHDCRGCAADAECPDHVCLESQGVCEAQSDVIFLRADGTDAGTCTASAPCLTLGYAFQKILGSRHVIHLLGTTFSMGNVTVALPGVTAVIDGEDTTLQFNGSGAAFSQIAGTTELSHVSVGRSGSTWFSLSDGILDLFAVVAKGQIIVTGGSLAVTSSVLQQSNGLGVIQCSNGGEVAVRTSTIHDKVRGTDCPTTLQRNHFDSPGGAFQLAGSAISTIENNVITSTDYSTDGGSVTGVAGTTVRFNSFVNFSGVDMGGTPLYCFGQVNATSNIFAWHSSAAPNGCSPQYSLFDNTVGLQPGTGNRVGDSATFFVDLQGSNFHPAPSSPALDGAEPGLPVDVDIDGNRRPNGPASDIGAYEAQ